jgi:hypothetical protein
MTKPERMIGIQLAVDIPGPKSLEDPLEEVEKTFLERYRSGLVTEIAEGRLWQGD